MIYFRLNSETHLTFSLYHLTLSLMKKLILLFLLSCFSGKITAQIQDTTMSFEEYDPVSTLVVPGEVVKSAKFPFIDVHNHQWRMATADLKALAAEMDSLNMKVMVNLSGRSGEELKA